MPREQMNTSVSTVFFIAVRPQKFPMAGYVGMRRLKTALDVQKTAFFINKLKFP